MTVLSTKLTQAQDHDLHRAAFEARKGTRFVKVEKEALENLLIDHGKALAALPDGYKTPEGKHV